MDNPLPLPDNFDTLPDFQKIQYLIGNHIRDPENNRYSAQKQPGLVLNEIEPRRLAIYESLFYTNLFDFFSSIFPVLKGVVGDARWADMTREFLQKHHARSPLFHELGQEFIGFIQNELTPIESDPAFMLELAHYEWVELAVDIEQSEGPLNPEGVQFDWQKAYELSPVAWPVGYEWPVHRISTKSIPTETPEWPTTLLVYRDDEDKVQFMELSPVLFELLSRLLENDSATAMVLVTELADAMGQPAESITGFAAEILQDMLEQNIISEIGAEV